MAAHSFAEKAGAKLPEWFLRGVGGMAERHYNEGVAKFFGKQHLAKGGVKDLDSWLSKFRIAPDLERRQLDYNIYQAGLVIRFCMNGGDNKATDALMAVTKAFDKDGRSVGRAVANLEGRQPPHPHRRRWRPAIGRSDWGDFYRGLPVGTVETAMARRKRASGDAPRLRDHGRVGRPKETLRPGLKERPRRWTLARSTQATSEDSRRRRPSRPNTPMIHPKGTDR